jgi:hypothetical protein
MLISVSFFLAFLNCFAQEDDFLLIKYKLGTELSYFLENEGEPVRTSNWLGYNNQDFIKTIDAFGSPFKFYYNYRFLDNQLDSTVIYFTGDTMQQYMEVYNNINEYCNNKYGFSSPWEADSEQYISYMVKWKIEDEEISLIMSIPKINPPLKNNIKNISLIIGHGYGLFNKPNKKQ